MQTKPPSRFSESTFSLGSVTQIKERGRNHRSFFSPARKSFYTNYADSSERIPSELAGLLYVNICVVEESAVDNCRQACLLREAALPLARESSKTVHHPDFGHGRRFAEDGFDYLILNFRT